MKGIALFGFAKKAREAKAFEDTQRNLLENVLRKRLHSLVDAVTAYVMRTHELSLDQIAFVEERADNIKVGIDLVLLEHIGWRDERIPANLQGGALIANSAHAHFFLGIDLNDPTIFDLIGTEDDRQTTGHICYDLGFTRDGLTIRD